jgi:hypothetical protein
MSKKRKSSGPIDSPNNSPSWCLIQDFYDITMKSSKSRTSEHTKNKVNRTKSLESKKLSKQIEILYKQRKLTCTKSEFEKSQKHVKNE